MRRPQRAASRSPPAPVEDRSPVVRPLPFVGSDQALVDGLRVGHPAAIAAFCDRYSSRVLRVLGRILGAGSEIADLHHDVFVRALASARRLEDAATLEGWITTIAVNVARTALKRRARRRWLEILPWYEVPEVATFDPSDEDAEALRITYAIFARLPTDDRIAFALRTLDGMDLREVADACGVSLATTKRRLARAEAAFLEMARAEPVLAPWLRGGARWMNR